jgi:hypothetical protein
MFICIEGNKPTDIGKGSTMNGTMHVYGTDGSLTRHGLTDDTDLTARVSSHDTFMVLTLEHEGSEFQVFDSTNGKFMLKIADAIMTAIQDQSLAEARKQAETEHFARQCGDCLLPLAKCVHASEYMGA